MIVAVIIINLVFNIIIFLIGLKILDRFGEGGLWIHPKQTVIKALLFVPSITLVTTLLRFLPMGRLLGLIVWIIALMLVYRMEWYELLILALFFLFTSTVVHLLLIGRLTN